MEVERLDWKNMKFLIHVTVLRLPTQDKHSQISQIFLSGSCANGQPWDYQNPFICILILHRTERVFDLSLVYCVQCYVSS